MMIEKVSKENYIKFLFVVSGFWLLREEAMIYCEMRTLANHRIESL